MKQSVPMAAVVAAIVVILAIVGFFGFRTVASGGGEGEKVHVDANTVKESIKNNGFGGGH